MLNRSFRRFQKRNRCARPTSRQSVAKAQEVGTESGIELVARTRHAVSTPLEWLGRTMKIIKGLENCCLLHYKRLSLLIMESLRIPQLRHKDCQSYPALGSRIVLFQVQFYLWLTTFRELCTCTVVDLISTVDERIFMILTVMWIMWNKLNDFRFKFFWW